jgi:hypothetical protein
VKLIRNGVPTEAHATNTLPPHSAGGQLAAVRARTRARYSRPRRSVEEKIRRFLE